MKLTLDTSKIVSKANTSTDVNNRKVEKIVKPSGIVYLLEFTLEDKKLIKIGMTTRRIEDRVCEILVSIWKRYRVFPSCYVKRYSAFNNPADIEKRLHRELDRFRYKTRYTFSGHTEFFEVDIVSAVSLYDEVKKEQ